MFTKRLNQIILITSVILNYLFVMIFALILANLFWWMITPSVANVYVEKTNALQYEKSIKYIINHHPFGIVVVAQEQKSAAPPIAQQIKLTGIYYNPPKDSIAFIEYNTKGYIYKLNDDIANSGAIITAINIDNILITQNDNSANVKISAGSGKTVMSTDLNINTSFNRFGSGNNQANNINNNWQPQQNNYITEDLKEKRNKLIEEFIQKEQAGNNGQNGQGNNNNFANHGPIPSNAPDFQNK
jgi:type II secretory pathway component PulC